MSEGRFENFDLTFEREGDLYRPRVLESPLGERTGAVFSRLDLADATARMGVVAPERTVSEASGIEWEAARTLGGELYQVALGGGIRNTLEKAQSQLAERGQGLRLRLRLSGVPELAELPWEYLYNPDQNTFLSLETPMARYVDTSRRVVAPPIRPPLRILSVVNPPPGESPSLAEWEWEQLNRQLELLVRRGRVVLDRLQPPTAESLYNRLRRGDYHALHFAGHGAFGPEGDTLRLEDDRGRDRLVTGPELAEIFSRGEQRLAVLNTVRSTQSSAPLAATAESLVRKGISSVIAVPWETMGAAVEPFSGELYERLSEGAPVEAAVAGARKSLVANREAKWGVPAVYTNAPERQILATQEGEPKRGSLSIGMGDSSFPVRGEGGEGWRGDGGGDRPGKPSPPPSRPRFLQGRFPPRVKLGDAVSLLARIGLDPGTDASAPLQDVTVPPEGLEAVLILNAPGFEIQGGNKRTLRIPLSSSSDWVHFDLKAVRPGVHSLEITAFVAGGPYLGSLSLEATVDTGISTSESREQRQTLRARRLRDDEIALRIWFDDERKVYRFLLNDGSILAAGDDASERLMETPSKAIEQLIAEINALARARVQLDARETHSRLRGKGIELWDLLIPGELQRRFWSLADGGIQRIFIVSDPKGDPIPWELLYPFQEGNRADFGFLAERFHISRWISRDLQAPPGALNLKEASFVDPVGNDLDKARAEIEDIRTLLQGRVGRTADPIRDLTSLLDLFEAGDFGLLHFACHNSYGSQTISLGAKPFQPSDLRAHRGRFAKMSPLVFLNACRSNSQEAHFTELSGWAAAFLRTGVGAFVGTLWEVRDETARLFAKEFYRALLEDREEPCSLGEALQAARDAIREHPGDPTWLAYTLYGDTTAVLNPGGIE